MESKMELQKLQTVLNTVGGIIRVVKRNEDSPRTYCIEDLQFSHDLTIYDAFTAIRELNGKTISEYGAKWPSFRNANGEISNRFLIIKEAIDKSANDFEKLKLACSELGEEFPKVLPYEKTKKNLESYKQSLQ